MKKIAVLIAMGMEAGYLIKRMENPKPETAGGKKFLRGKIGEAEVVLHQCGWGMRNADNGVRALAENYRPDMIINYGVSGSLRHEVGLFETVVAVSSYAATGEAYKAGMSAATDADLAAFAARTIGATHKSPVATSRGILVAKKRKARLVERSGAVCIDMESYTAAKAANELGVPLLVMRCISDTLELKSFLVFFKNGAIAADKIAACVEAVIRKLAET